MLFQKVIETIQKKQCNKNLREKVNSSDKEVKENVGEISDNTSKVTKMMSEPECNEINIGNNNTYVFPIKVIERKSGEKVKQEDSIKVIIIKLKKKDCTNVSLFRML